MKDFKSNNEEIIYKHDRTVRVISHFKNGNTGFGTGFIVNEGRSIFTCWHVICGIDLKDLLSKPDFASLEKDHLNKDVADYFQKISSNIQVEMPNGTILNVKLANYDCYYDLATLSLPDNVTNSPYFEIETTETLDYSDEIIFCGYPDTLGYNSLNSPFTVNTGVVSSFPQVEIAGGKYENIQLSSICIGGNSGAPLFKKGSSIVSGIVNGYQWRGHNNLAVFENGVYKHSVAHKVPLNISFATSFTLLKDKVNIIGNIS